ncbi:hydrolase [Fictibacillus arsenicus]|uniref:Hydrolase n=1 Tax=Fictibacillus arsenicus TaxID=255247 RepID=A0A1B1Z5F8_9BACL|nr:DHHA1 domain-containing protein [Fictibacillus arsenicus]ANX12579.1 hydrolase [Fictibacillus arsenicus]
MTKKIYYSSPYTKEWETIIRKSFTKENQCFVVLEETAFYPTGGGQPHDTGTINGVEVLDVFTDETGEVVHMTERMPETTHAFCSLNWRRRFEHMQHHSGQHLLSAVCYTLYNAKTVSFHLGLDYATIDLNLTELNPSQMEKIEQTANEEIYRNRKIHTYYVTSEELAELPLLKMPKVTENIQIVEIEGIEYNACGGTHVLRTGEIGIIKLIKAEKQKGMIKLYFKCGLRALQDFNESHQILGKIAAKFNTGRYEVIGRIEKWEEERKRLESELAKVKEENNAYVAKELLLKKEEDFLFHVFDNKSFNEIKELAIKIAQEHNLFILFAATEENKVILVHNGTENFSCGKFLKEHLGSFNGKGGGNDKTAQAGFPSKEDTVNFFEFAKQEIFQ